MPENAAVQTIGLQVKGAILYWNVGGVLVCLSPKMKSVTHMQCDARPVVTYPAAERHRPLSGTKLVRSRANDREEEEIYYISPLSRRRREMYCGHAHLCMCVCGPGCNVGSGRGCPLVVHYWADLQSVHGLRCYGNITRTQNVTEYMLVLAVCLVDILQPKAGFVQ